MPIDAIELLDLAEVLVDAEDEVSWRAAASRAYYACYHYAVPVNDGLDQSPTGDYGLHRQFINDFIKNPSSNIRAIGYSLQQCMRARINADYKIDTSFTQSEAAETTHQAKLTFDLIDKVSN